MQNNFFTYILLFGVLAMPALQAQDIINLKLKFEAAKNTFDISTIKYQTKFSDTTTAKTELKKVLNALWQRGYYDVYADSIFFENNIMYATIRANNFATNFLIKRVIYDTNTEMNNSFVATNKIYAAHELAKQKEKIISFYEQRAFPFAAVTLDSISESNNHVVANLKIQTNKMVKIDSINVIGNVQLNKKYLYHYIGIKPNDGYDERHIKSINNRLKELPFLTEKKAYNVIFTKKYTKLLLQLDKKKANRFDGFLGFLPDEKTTKINFTGQLSIKILNSFFFHGETVEVEWRKLQALTQDLKTNFIYPYIFNLPFGVEYNLKLYKRDTTFIDIANTIGLQYLLTGGNNLKFFVTKRNINLINTTGYEFVTTLPEFADVTNTSYGLAININNTDYKLNPRRGLKTWVQGTAGTKQIRKNLVFNPIVYDSLQLVTQQYQLQGATSFYIPVFKKSTVMIDVKYATIIGKNIFTNELYRIGGLVSLRGFDEESINASAYVIPAIEYRFLFDKNSAIFLFANAAYYENVSRSKRVFDRPFGFGTGLFFETKAGIFSLTYALGKQFDNPILIKNAKIHFGLVSIF